MPPDAARGASDVVQVLAVAPGSVEPELVEARSASEDQVLAE